MSRCSLPFAWLGPVLLAWAGPASAQDIVFATWGGAHGALQRATLVEPFYRSTGLRVQLRGVDERLRARVGAIADGVAWDGISLPYEALEAACAGGRLRPLDPGQLAAAADGTPAVQDFLPGLLHRCGVGEVLWSMLPAYAARAFGGRTPNRIADLFDLENFPGPRALHRHPRGLLEWALLADGVPAEQVYSTLATPAGLDRAMHMLERIGPAVRWWTRLAEPREWLIRGEVVMAAVLSDDYLLNRTDRPGDYPLLWDGHLWQASYWAIPATSQAVEEARRFIRFSTTTRAQAERARFAPQGPARLSAVLAYDSPLKRDLPSWPGNFERGLRWDQGWWREHGEAVELRFRQWLATLPSTVPGAARIPVPAQAPDSEPGVPGVAEPGPGLPAVEPAAGVPSASTPDALVPASAGAAAPAAPGAEPGAEPNTTPTHDQAVTRPLGPKPR